MDKNTIICILANREGYTEKRAIILANECLSLSTELKPLLERWLQNADDKGDFSIYGYSLLKMMQQGNLKFVAALLNMDWLIKEPEKALPVIKSFIK